jgi:CBS domain-containing membrane protein
MGTRAIPVSKLMTKEVVTLNANEPLSFADDVMRLGRIRHMPVVDDDGELVGILSQRDLFRDALARTLGYGSHAQAKVLGMLRAKEVMSTGVETIEPNTPLDEAAQIMLRKKIGCLVVVEAQEIVGILTESDFVRLAVDG